jgi:transcriptional regulator with XRE-family HTH domain
VPTMKPTSRGVRHAGGPSKPPTPAPGAVALAALLQKKRGEQARLAARLHVSQGHLSDICRGVKYASGSLAFAIQAETGIPAQLFVAPRQRRAA